MPQALVSMAPRTQARHQKGALGTHELHRFEGLVGPPAFSNRRRIQRQVRAGPSQVDLTSAKYGISRDNPIGWTVYAARQLHPVGILGQVHGHFCTNGRSFDYHRHRGRLHGSLCKVYLAQTPRARWLCQRWDCALPDSRRSPRDSRPGTRSAVLHERWFLGLKGVGSQGWPAQKYRTCYRGSD